MDSDSGSDFIYEDSLVKTEARRIAFDLSQGRKATTTSKDRTFSKQVLEWLPHYIDLVNAQTNSEDVAKSSSGGGHLHFLPHKA